MSGPTTDPHEPANAWGEHGMVLGGLTKREMIAAMVMQGLAANNGGPWQANGDNGWALTNCTLAEVAEVCTDAADELIKRLNE